MDFNRFVGLQRISLVLNGFQLRQLIFNGFKGSMDLNQFQQNKFQWISIDLNYISMDFNGFQWISIDLI